MLYSNSIEYKEEQGIFPLIIFEKNSQDFRCIGTSFMINGSGIFVTAKHVIDKEFHADNLMYVVQGLSNGKTVCREVNELCIHPNADLVIGKLGIARDPITAQPVPYEIAPNCRLSFKVLPQGTQLAGFGYGKTTKSVAGSQHTFNFNRTWAQGEVIDFLSQGSGKVKNRCYISSMNIHSGSSGGPVFNEGYVVGINSGSFDLSGQEDPISFITPIDFILNLQLTDGKESLSMREAIKRGAIIVEKK